jgi:flagellar protein FlgJ
MVSPIDNPSVYTDLAGLNDISSLGRENTPEGLKRVAQQFESMFMNIMLKAMRDSTKAFSEGNYMQSNELEFHQQNFDNQMSLHLSEGAGIGLANVLYEQMMGQFGLEQEPKSATRSDFPTPERRPSGLTTPPAMNLAPSVTNSAHLQAPQLPEFEPANAIAPNAMPIEALRAALAARGQSSTSQPVMLQKQPLVPQVSTEESGLNTPAQFVKALFPAAEKVAERIGVDPRMLLAQSALETGWGKRMITRSDGSTSHNLFGIKADSRWSGEKASVMTTEVENGVLRKEHANFRAYDSYEDSLNDYVDFLKSNPRYQEALKNSHDAEAFASHLQQAGYATDPVYANKISRVMNSDTMSFALSEMTNNVL